SAEAGQIATAPESDEPVFVIENVDIDSGGRFPSSPHAGGGDESVADSGSQVVGAEVHGRDTAAKQHADREIPSDVDECGDRSAVELASARTSLELRPHRHRDPDLLAIVVK